MCLKTSLLLLALCLLSGCGTIHAQTSCFSEGSVRLQGLSSLSAGRVEVCHNSVWGTVCSVTANAQWSLKNAQVVCRQLELVAAVTALPQDQLTVDVRADIPVPIHYNDVRCNGTETELQNCSLSTDVTSCTHFTDAAIVCLPGGATAGDVRLLGDEVDYRGAVEFYDDRLGWVGVCADSAHSDSWTSNRAAARIVCRQLGYEGGRPFRQSIQFSSPNLQVANLQCSEDSHFSLDECSRDDIIFTGRCETTEAGWVECSETDAEDFSVRLVGASREGVLEVAYNGRWGTVCEDVDWGSDDAGVVCDELGLETESINSIFPSGNYDQYMSRLKPFWLSSVQCLTGDDTIEECDRDSIIGYSTSCSGASSFSVFNSAEVDCGDPIPFRLGGGAIAGIVIASIAVVFVVVMGFIYLPERWKRRHTYPWWNKLTTPSRWCENVHLPSVALRRSHHGRAAVATLSPDPAQYPPATYRQTLERQETQPPSQSAPTESTREPEPGRQEQVERGAENVFGNLFSSPQQQATPPTPPGPSQPQGDLTAAAPPSYQAAVSYPAAAAAPPPPAYMEKMGPYPDPSAAYPPPIPSAPPAAIGGASALPYPPALTLEPAVPFPQEASALPYPPAQTLEPAEASALPYPLAQTLDPAYPPPPV